MNIIKPSQPIFLQRVVEKENHFINTVSVGIGFVLTEPTEWVSEMLVVQTGAGTTVDASQYPQLPPFQGRCFVNTIQGEFKEISLTKDKVMLLPAKDLGVVFFQGTFPVQDHMAYEVEHYLIAIDQAPLKSIEHYHTALQQRLGENRGLYALKEDDLLPGTKPSVVFANPAPPALKPLATPPIKTTLWSHEILEDKEFTAQDFSAVQWQSLQFRRCRFKQVRWFSSVLEQVTFSECEFQEVLFYESTLQATTWHQTHCQQVTYVASHLQKMHVSQSTWQQCQLNQQPLRECQFQQVRLQRCRFVGAIIDRCDWQAVVAEQCAFSGAAFCIQQSRFKEWQAKECNFTEASISDSQFDACTLSGNMMMEISVNQCTFTHCDFQQAQLANSVWENSTLQKNNFQAANWIGVRFKDCQLKDNNEEGVCKIYAK